MIAELLTVPVSAVGQLVTLSEANPQSPLAPAAFATDPPAPFELDHKLSVSPSRVLHSHSPVDLSQIPLFEHSLDSRFPVTLAGFPP